MPLAHPVRCVVRNQSIEVRGVKADQVADMGRREAGINKQSIGDLASRASSLFAEPRAGARAG